MNISGLNLIYFSATGTTKKIVSTIASEIKNMPTRIIDISGTEIHQEIIDDNTLTIVGIPVYSGRITQIATDRLLQIKSNGGYAIAVCTYGNRDYDDALLELYNILSKQGFKVIAAAAFIGEHSIFPTIASGRPNITDLQIAKQFGSDISKLTHYTTLNIERITGNYPYREAKRIPLHPHINKRKCNSCGRCLNECPTGAIITPTKLDKHKCIACAHCISICPQKARHFSGILYKIAYKSFIKKYSEPKQPIIIM